MAVEDRTGLVPAAAQAAGADDAPQPAGSRLGRFFREARRYPILPIIILMVVLIIPAIFLPTRSRPTIPPGETWANV